jgi:hypothetical protein
MMLSLCKYPAQLTFTEAHKELLPIISLIQVQPLKAFVAMAEFIVHMTLPDDLEKQQGHSNVNAAHGPCFVLFSKFSKP